MWSAVADPKWAGTPLGPEASWSPALRATHDMIMASPLAMCAAWGPDLNLIYNEAYAHILGAKHPRAFGKPILDVWREVSDDIAPLIDDTMAGRPVMKSDMHLVMNRHGHDEDTWWTFAYSALRDEGKVAGFLDVVIETTALVVAARERDAAEAKLRARNAELEREAVIRTLAHDRFATMIEHLPVGVCLLDPDGQSLVANPAYRKLLPDLPLPSSMQKADDRVRWLGLDDQGARLSPDQYPGARALRGELVSPGVEFLYLGENGQETWVSVSAVPLVDASGQPGGAIAIINDIDERKRALETARSNAERIGFALAAGAIIGTWVWDIPSDRFTVDEAFALNFGLDPALGRSGIALQQVVETVHPDDRAGLSEAIAEAVERGGRYAHTYRVRRNDGQYYWLEANGHVEHSMDGTPLRFPGVLIDREERRGLVEERDRALTELRRLNDTLEDRVAERTEELRQSEEALRQAQKMEAVGQLTGGLAHDFNNLLTAVTGGLDLLKIRIERGQLDRIDRYVDMAQTGAKRAAALTQRLLAFSRRQTLAPTAVSVDQLVTGMENIVDRTLGPSIEVAVVGTVGLWPVLVDAPQLENALLNLCINARDAMPDGGRLTIETANKALDERAAVFQDLPSGEYVSLCVSDTGTGMPPEVIERIFDPFYTTKPLGEGTGLGLSMIYGFVRQSGGQVRVYSEVGQGTTICLYLPRYVGELDRTGIEAAAEARRHAGAGDTVLIVEDEVAIRSLVCEVLNEAGYRMLEASNGPAAVKLLQGSERIDLLITDVGLPGGLNGRQVADAGRALRDDLKVLFVTGYAANAAVGAGQLDEGMAVLTKPFNVLDLERRVHDMVKAGR